jgi:hypothetical protein
METIAGLGMETAVGVGETAVGESIGTVGAETMAEFSSAFGETMSASVDSTAISGLSSIHFQMSLNGSAFATELNISKINSVFFIVFFLI